MAENSGIEWTTHTFNPWVGCTKISAACDHCYAEAWAKRAGRAVWGARAERQQTKTWGNPVKWNRQAEGAKERPRVFCASLADVFDNHKSILPEWRELLWKLIRETPNLDWLLLTKRPQNIARYLPADWGAGYPNVWLGTTVEDQKAADQRIPHLLNVPCAVRFISAEPLLGPVDFRWIAQPDPERDGVIDALKGRDWITPALKQEGDFKPARPGHEDRNLNREFVGEPFEGIHWIITGGESGPNYRPANVDWFRSIRDQCAETDTAFLFKQYEGTTSAKIKAMGRELDGVVHDGYPVPS